ncbi:hypothetical protein AG1IA_08861 [Rhizoctonia solani AG-1 IA]|uniref:Uncharacterized protein n=1 Tax=Thanatephorus cucumeris (strain AG1-IA) TaxID=983506 RepID=L8WK34_THACA|nr:hypothetical protein AG1IA_08861 [Rhizoctonia solani AG-1 IA]
MITTCIYICCVGLDIHSSMIVWPKGGCMERPPQWALHDVLIPGSVIHRNHAFLFYEKA